MDLSQILDGKKVCVLMTCKREPYIERVKAREYIYEMIQRNDFIFFYLYADPKLEYSSYVEYVPDTSRYILTVKICDSWNALGERMHLCYSFFNQFNIKGILKIDDDIHIDCEYESMIFNEKYFNYDYMGAMEKKDSVKEISDKKIRYFGGPFYWVSKAAIQKIIELSPVSFIEDANVGYCMDLWDACKRHNTNWCTNSIVTWEYNS